jgi:hypothetical protein
MGKLAGWGLWHGDSKQCSNCGMTKAKNDGCCKDKHQLVKFEKDQQPHGTAVQLPQLSAVLLSPVFSGTPDLFMPVSIAPYPVNHAPPQWGQQPAYLLHCTFLI